MKAGFTGTQDGMNAYQKIGIHKILLALKKNGYGQFHHGDCVGADAQAHEIANDMNYTIVIHPPINPKKRAYCKNAYEVKPEKEYLDRNHDIVDETDLLIATPKGEEELRSGTWSTIRYAKKQNKNIVIIYPNKTEILKGQ